MITVGSRVKELQKLAIVFSIALVHGIQIEWKWLPRENQLADCLSKVTDYDEYSINAQVFAWVDAIRGSHTMDEIKQQVLGCGHSRN